MANKIIIIILGLFFASTASACGMTGKASWYDYSLKSAPNYSKYNLTAASRDFKRGTKLEVCAKDPVLQMVNGKIVDTGMASWDKCIVVRVNDYGPNKQIHPDRIIDLSSYAFQHLAPLRRGVIEVSVKEAEL